MRTGHKILLIAIGLMLLFSGRFFPWFEEINNSVFGALDKLISTFIEYPILSLSIILIVIALLIKKNC